MSTLERTLPLRNLNKTLSLRTLQRTLSSAKNGNLLVLVYERVGDVDSFFKKQLRSLKSSFSCYSQLKFTTVFMSIPMFMQYMLHIQKWLKRTIIFAKRSMFDRFLNTPLFRYMLSNLCSGRRLCTASSTLRTLTCSEFFLFWYTQIYLVTSRHIQTYSHIVHIYSNMIRYIRTPL